MHILVLINKDTLFAVPFIVVGILSYNLYRIGYSIVWYWIKYVR